MFPSSKKAAKNSPDGKVWKKSETKQKFSEHQNLQSFTLPFVRQKNFKMSEDWEKFFEENEGPKNIESVIDQVDSAVIFLYRSKTLKPFERHFQNVNIFEMMTKSEDGKYEVSEDYSARFAAQMEAYQQSKERLLTVNTNN